MKAWAASVDAKMRAKIDADVAALQKQVDAVKQENQRLKDSQHAARNAQQTKVDRAMADLREGHKKAMAEFKSPGS